MDVEAETNPQGQDPGPPAAADGWPGDDDRPASTRTSATAPGRRTRRDWLDRRDDRPPSTPAQPSKRARAPAGCGRPVCGDEGPSAAAAARVCSACKEAPTMTATGPRWNHFKSDEQVEDLVKAWNEWFASKSGVVCTYVKEGFLPTTRKDYCFCNRGACFLRQALNWRVQQAGGANRRACGVCASTKSPRWRTPGARRSLLFARYFTSSHATCSRLYDAGGTLDGDGWLCNKCWVDGDRKAPKAFSTDKSTVGGYLNHLDLNTTPPSRNTRAFAEQEMLLYCLRRLKEGELVYLPDAVDVMRSARKRAELKGLQEESLRPKVLGMFRDLARGVAGVEHHKFDGDAVGGGHKRASAHYLMPSKFNPLYVASLHRDFCRPEKEAETRSSTEGGTDG